MSPGFVRLLSYSSWFCLASTTRLLYKSKVERNIGFHPYTVVQEQFTWILQILCGFFPTAPGFVWIPYMSPAFVWLLSYSSWFYLASTTQIQSGAEHRISFLFFSSLHGFSPGFVRLLSYSSWFCMDSLYVSWFCAASFLQLLVLFGFHNSLTIQIRSGAGHRISSLLLCRSSLLILCGFFPTAPGFIWLPQLKSEVEWNIGFYSYFSAVCMDSLLVLCGFFPTTPGFVRLPQLA